MNSRPRTCRTVEFNVGIRKKYQKTLFLLHRDFQNFVLNQILLKLDADNFLAQDAITKLSERDKQKLKELKKKVLAKLAKNNPERLREKVDQIVSSNMTQWLALLGTASSTKVAKLLHAAAVATSSAQKKALLSAHFNMGLVKQRWSVPIVGRQYVAPQTLNVVQAAIRDNVNLIKKISANDVNRISDVLIKGLSEGKNQSELRQELALTDGFDKKRIERVVIDQTNKLNNAVQTANANSLGITEAIWVHVAGQYTSRPSHVKMNGQKFDINKGIYDPEVGFNVTCGQLPFCRCTMRLLFRPDQVDEE